MAAHVHPSTATATAAEVPLTRARALRFVVPLGRFLFALIFVLSGFGHFSAGTIGYAASRGVPAAHALVPLSGALAIAGGLSIMLGFWTRLGALALVAFLVPVTLAMHDFWAIHDPQLAMVQRAMFMKNLSMLGGALLVLYFGGGPLSVDLRLRRGRRRETTPVDPLVIDHG